MENNGYCKEVWSKGKEETKKYYSEDRRGWVFNVVSSLLVAIIIPIINCVFGVVMIENFWLSVLAGVTSGIIFFVIWYIGTRICFWLSSPAKMYHEQEKTIKGLQAKIKRKKEIKRNISIKRDTELYLGNSIVYLKIDNQENKDIRDCYATMRRLEYKHILGESTKEQYQKDYIWQNWLVVSNLNKNYLSWPAFDQKEEKIIRAKSVQRIDIARIEKDKLVFLYTNEDSGKWTKSGEYYLEVVFGGYIEGKQIEPEEFHGLLRYVIKDNKHEIYLFEKDFDEVNK